MASKLVQWEETAYEVEPNKYTARLQLENNWYLTVHRQAEDGAYLMWKAEARHLHPYRFALLPCTSKEEAQAAAVMLAEHMDKSLMAELHKEADDDSLFSPGYAEDIP